MDVGPTLTKSVNFIFQNKSSLCVFKFGGKLGDERYDEIQNFGYVSQKLCLPCRKNTEIWA